MSSSNGHASNGLNGATPNGRTCRGCRMELTGRKRTWCSPECSSGKRPPVVEPDATERDPLRWLPAHDDDLKTERLKRQALEAFLKAAEGRSVEVALGVLLEMAAADGKPDGEGRKRPRYHARTRRLAAEAILRATAQMVTGKDTGTAGAGENPLAGLSIEDLGSALLKRRTEQFGPR